MYLFFRYGMYFFTYQKYSEYQDKIQASGDIYKTTVVNNKKAPFGALINLQFRRISF